MPSLLMGCVLADRSLRDACLFEDGSDDASADGATALADREAGSSVQRHGGDQLHLQVHVSPGITISTPSGRITDPVTSMVRM